MMQRAVLFISLIAFTAVSAWAANEPQKAPSGPPAPASASAPAQSPALPSASAVPAPQHDLDWLLQTGAVSPAAPPAVNPLDSALPASCLTDCLASGDDLICCRYRCHPIGQNPC